jgi:transposase
VEIAYGRQMYKKRGLIERIFGKVKENRRLAVRYEKSDVNFLGFIIFAFIKINLC